jgi:hypothetical protein
MKSKILKYKLEIKIWDIEVKEFEHYPEGRGKGMYYFNYSIKNNGGKEKKGEYSSSWSSQTKREITRKLKNGYASELVFEQIK